MRNVFELELLFNYMKPNQKQNVLDFSFEHSWISPAVTPTVIEALADQREI